MRIPATASIVISLSLFVLAACDGGKDKVGSGTVTTITGGTGIVVSPDPVEDEGTVSIDPAVVPQLAAANTFSNANTFSSLTVTGETSITGDLNGNHAVAKNLVLGAVAQGVSFTGANITSGGALTMSARDGITSISCTGTCFADVHNDFGTGSTWNAQVTGSMLAFRANATFAGMVQSASVTYGMNNGAPGAGGYGFVWTRTGGNTVLSGRSYNLMGATVESADLVPSLTAGVHSYVAVNRGEDVEFFVDGASVGTVTAMGMGTSTRATYRIRADSSDAAALDFFVGFLTVTSPMF